MERTKAIGRLCKIVGIDEEQDQDRSQWAYCVLDHNELTHYKGVLWGGIDEDQDHKFYLVTIRGSKDKIS